MKFVNALIDIKNIDWQLFEDGLHTWGKKYYKYSLIASKGLQKIVDLLKGLGYQRSEIPRPHELKPKEFFIPNEQLFTEQEQQEVDKVIASMEFNRDFGISILQWAKMCDKGYDITKGNEDLYDGLLFALKKGVITRACSERMLVIGSISTPFTAWPEPYYSRWDVASHDIEISELSKKIEEEEKAKGSETP